MLACACPETRARTTSEGGSLNLKRLVKIGLLYVMTLSAFFVLFQSDPGYLTVDIMKDWDNGAMLEGGPCDFAESEEELENSHISETATATMNQGGLTPRNNTPQQQLSLLALLILLQQTMMTKLEKLRNEPTHWINQ
jgi:hypothetical protein